LELQGLAGRPRSLPLSIALLAAIAAGLIAASPAAAVTVTKTVTVASTAPVLITTPNQPPTGYRLTAARVEQIAATSPTIRAELRRHPRAIPYEYTKGGRTWQVSWFSAGRHQVELAQVYVSDVSGQVTQAWTGFQVAWSMARGYPGAFGRSVNHWYVWIPLCLLFLAPFLPWPSLRRRRRARTPKSPWRPGLLHLDLLVLLGFSISLALFNHARIGLSVPLVYPFLIYLLVRMLLLASGRGRPRAPLRLTIPVPLLVIGVVFLVGFRVGLNVSNSNVIDVGYAGVIGADKLLHGHDLYGHWPKDNAEGDTYGPANYYAYVPFRAIFGWSGTWDDLPAAHAAAIAFDLLTLLGLFLLGRRIRGPTLGVVLAYAWASYPFTLWALSSNTNDALVGLMVVAALLVAGSAPARGIVGALAGLTKFAPLALIPLFWRGTGGRLPGRRSSVGFIVAFVATLLVAMLPVLLDDNLHAFWHDTIVYQAGRTTPFSIWGLWGGLGFVQHLVEGAVVALALIVAVVPRRRGLTEMAALAGAVLIALQLASGYWLYSYIVWFFPAVLVAVFGIFPARAGEVVTERAREPARSPSPALARSL
jgi:hypothetical protein